MEPERHPHIYFAYGSNLNTHDMKLRAPDSYPICAATLPDYRLTFTSVLTVERMPGEHVVGGLFYTSAGDTLLLDRYEGYPTFYEKRFTHVKIQGKREYVYFYAIPESNVRPSPPWGGYYETCAEGYRDFGLDIKELEAARSRALSLVKLAPLEDIAYIEIPDELDLAADLAWTPRG
jgi:hypothetical protein